MCGRFALDDRVNAAIVEFMAETGQPAEAWQGEWRPSYNVRPTDPVPIMFETLRDRHDPSSQVIRRAELAQWWLAPSFAKTLKSANPMFNAKSETAAELASFRTAVKRARAVLPAIGYYESMHDGGRKAPQFISAPDGLLYFAGLYSWWADPAAAKDDPARWRLTATILTRPAAGEVAAVHDRTPVTLPLEVIGEWIDPLVEGDRGLIEAMAAASTPVVESLRYHELPSPITGDSVRMIRPVAGNAAGERPATESPAGPN